MAREIPLGMEGVQRFRPADYDGPVQAVVLTEGGGTVTFETAGGQGADDRLALLLEARAGRAVGRQVAETKVEVPQLADRSFPFLVGHGSFSCNDRQARRMVGG
jgi:hypothetical protein